MTLKFLVGLALVGACATTRPAPPAGPPASPPPPVVPVVPSVPNAGEHGALHVEGARFVTEEGQEWKWRGFTDFALLKRVCDGEDIRSILDERIAAGVNLVRVLGMAHNLFDLSPLKYPNYWDCTHQLASTLADRGLRMEFVVLADAQFVLTDVPTQRFHFSNTVNAFAGQWNVVLELCNECSKNGVDPRNFNRPSGVLVSHGSGLTDFDTVQPRWDFAGYHARRDGSRGFTNYDVYEFQAVYPQPVPLVPDEGAKPENYGNDVQYAYLMGRHASIGNGGTFHTTSGLQSLHMTDAELRCAEAFFKGAR